MKVVSISSFFATITTSFGRPQNKSQINHPLTYVYQLWKFGKDQSSNSWGVRCCHYIVYKFGERRPSNSDCDWRGSFVYLFYYLRTCTIVELCCYACKMPIREKFVLKVENRYWHGQCLMCVDCRLPLRDKCFVKTGQTFCKDDFYRCVFSFLVFRLFLVTGCVISDWLSQ